MRFGTRVVDLPLETVHCARLAFAIYRWNKYLEYPEEAVGQILLACSLSTRCPLEPLLNSKAIECSAAKCQARNACYLMDLLFQRHFVTKKSTVAGKKLNNRRSNEFLECPSASKPSARPELGLPRWTSRET